MHYIYPNFTKSYYQKVVLLLGMLFLLTTNAQAQTCTPQGDQTTYGQGVWLGYVYDNLVAGNPPATPFPTANYKGYITRSETFDMDLADGSIPAESTLCTSTTYANNFAIRFKMQKTLAAGYYTYTVGGDDGYRLSVDGGATFSTTATDWADHSYGYKTPTFYHAGGVISLVLEYYERNGLARINFNYAPAACTTTAPTSISGTLTVNCTTGTTLTAAGGTAGTGVVYQWGTGSIAGSNIISGATTAAITVQPLSTTTYWVRRVAAAPCSNTTDAAFATVVNSSPAPGDPSVFGSSTWNVYAYKGADITLGSGAEYTGYYTAPTLGFDTTTYWAKATSPSSYSGWNGCTIPIDNFTFVHKRQGFPCGSYIVQLDNWDDDVIVYINGTSVYSHNGYSGGVGAQSLGTFTLDANSTIEVRVKEAGGDANAKLSITATNVTGPPTTVSGNLSVGCGNETTTLTASGGVAGTGFTYEWGTGTVGGVNTIAGQTTVNLTVSPAVTTTYWVRRVGPAPCYTPTTVVTATVTRANPIPGNPATFGNNVWNLYGYSGTDLNTLSNNTYLGYYSFSTLGFDTQSYWGLTASPSAYTTPTTGTTAWGGCPVPVDNFTFVHKRQGFPCGVYTFTLNRWDDAAQLYINGTMVWSSAAWSGDPEVAVVVGTYQLDPNSTVEFRTEETTGNAAAKLTLTAVTSTDPTAITGPSVVCTTSSITLTATGAVPTINTEYQWGTGTIGTNIIAGQTGATLTVTPGTTTTYWVRIKNTVCNTYTTGITKTVTVPAAVTYSNGTWSGTPSIYTPVTVSSNLDVTQPLEACSCMVNNGATVVVNTGATFTIKGQITVATGSFFISQNNAAVVQIDDNVTNSGNISVKKNTNPLYRNDYTMWSSPVTGQQLLGFSIFTNPTRFYTYGDIDANNVYYDQFVSTNSNANFAVATGYLIRMPNTITGGPTGNYYNGTETLIFEGTFKGVPNNGTINKPLNTLGNRYTAVGNPYPSPISVKEFFNQNSAVLDGTSAMYFWRKKNNALVSSYASLTLAAFVANGATPDNTSTPTPGYTNGGQDQALYFSGSTYGNNASWLLAPGQGFIVRAKANLTNPQLSFNNTMRKSAPTSGGESFFKNADIAEASRFWLNLTSSTGFSQMAVAYIDGATLDIDYGYDGKKIGSTDATLYSIGADESLTIQARPAFEPADEVQLGFVADTLGSYTIKLDHFDGAFASGQNIYLKDKLLGLTHNMSESAYTFATEAGTFDNRFTIVYMEPLSTSNPVLTTNNVIVYKDGNSINITTGNIDMTDVSIYDIRGRVLYTKSGINATETSITNLQAQQEVLIVEITTPNGKVSKKIVY